MEIDEIGVDELPRLVAVRNAVWPHDLETVEGYIDWRAQAADMLKTFNEERNEPIRRLNERHGYLLEPGFVTVRGTIPEDTIPEERSDR